MLDYSFRKACIGSILANRSAGSAHAASATPMSTLSKPIPASTGRASKSHRDARPSLQTRACEEPRPSRLIVVIRKWTGRAFSRGEPLLEVARFQHDGLADKYCVAS